MKKTVLIASIFLATVAGVNAQVLLGWNTFGNLGTETSESSVLNDPLLSTSNLTLGSGVTAAANGNRFGGSGWFDTGNTASGNTLAEAIAGNSFIEFVVTPTAGNQFTATSFQFYWDRSGTGPQSVTLRSSFDSFASDLGTASGLTQGGTFTLSTISISGLTDVSAATTFRLYGTGATATAGTGGFDSQLTPVDISTSPNVVLIGTTSVIPEPSTWALIGLGSAFMLWSIRRRRSANV
jgi:hypothetical protein